MAPHANEISTLTELPEKSPKKIDSSQDAEQVLIPDLFISWAATPAKVNPHLATMEPEAVKWFNELCNHNEKESSRMARGRFCYLAAVCSPDCSAEELRTMCDWMHWVFVFDDKIDERAGDMKHNRSLVQREVDESASLFTDHPAPYTISEDPVRHTFDLIWQRIRDTSTPGVQKRYIDTSLEYLHALVDQTDPSNIKTNGSVEEFVISHRGSSGAKIACHLNEYSLHLDIPDHIFAHPDVQRIVDLVAELVVLINGVASHVKEVKRGDEHNPVTLLRMQGLGEQEAYDGVGEVLKQKFKEWEQTAERVKLWDERGWEFIEKCCKPVVLGILEMSFTSERYFGKEGDVVRKTRKVEAVPLPKSWNGS